MADDAYKSSYKTSRRYGLAPLSISVDKAVKPILRKFGFAESRLITDWVHIVGEMMDEFTNVQRVRYSKNKEAGGTLYVEVYHSSLAAELIYQEGLILEKIATYFGYRAIEKIKWVHRPGYEKKRVGYDTITPTEASADAKQNIHIMTQEIEDEVLRRSLEKLGSHIYGMSEK